MQIDIKEITNGSYDGKKVFICDYRRPDLQKKPIRKVPPTEVLVRSNSELPDNKRVYYSHSHFVKLKANGEGSSTVIKPYDSTGFRSYTGKPLNVYDTMAECVAQWNNDVQTVYDRLDAQSKVVLQNIYNDMNKVKALKQ